MKVLMVADARSVHTRRWAASLTDAGVETVLYSLYPSPDSFFVSRGIRLYFFDLFTYKVRSGFGRVAGMLQRHRQAVSHLKSVIRMEKPDVLHAHYATSFGLIAALSGFRPFIISVWGSDVYEFPYKSPVNRMSLKLILGRADRILSTSEVMARHTACFTSAHIEVIPFGVDTGAFRPYDKEKEDDGCFVVGNVKTLSPKYGIDTLIRAFRLVVDRNPGKKLKLVIVGDGPCRGDYGKLACELGISDRVFFEGFVPNDRLPEYYNSFSVSVSLSRSESFGVVAVEAMACGCPVITSDAEGFKEVVRNGETGYIVPRDNPEAAADAIQRFIDNPSLRAEMGNAGVGHVRRLYDWDSCINQMVKVYTDVGKS